MGKRTERNRGVVRGQPSSFYNPKEGKKPILLYILPILMVIVLLGTLYLAYRDTASQEGASSSVSSVISRS